MYTLPVVSDYEAWGPLAPLIGEWEGDEGIDVSFSNERRIIAKTPYREKTSMKAFGPVENGTQSLYGLAHTDRNRMRRVEG